MSILNDKAMQPNNIYVFEFIPYVKLLGKSLATTLSKFSSKGILIHLFEISFLQFCSDAFDSNDLSFCSCTVVEDFFWDKLAFEDLASTTASHIYSWLSGHSAREI